MSAGTEKPVAELDLHVSRRNMNSYTNVVVGLLFALSLTHSHFHFDFVPEVVKEAPQSVLMVKYGSAQVNMGNELTPTQVKAQPFVTWDADENAFYTICMTDPDAPSRENPTVREFLHWLVVNVPGNKIEDGEVLAQYVGSGPPKGTGLHRYIFLVFKQGAKMPFADELRRNNTSRVGRKKFSIQKFSSSHGFQEPATGGNFFQAQWDDYVPTVHKQLSGE